MLRGTRHNRSTRPDPTCELELFPADEIPATNFSSPLSSSAGPDGPPNAEAPLTPDRNAIPDGPISSDDGLETTQTESHTPPTDPVPTDESLPADDFAPLFARLARSAFRSRFRLRTTERTYIERIGFPTLRRHAEEFVRMRLAPALPPNDGRQTPMRGHPVFIAQHATGCCCRGCLSKWHGIPAGRPLTEAEQHYIVRVLLTWILRQLGR